MSSQKKRQQSHALLSIWDQAIGPAVPSLLLGLSIELVGRACKLKQDGACGDPKAFLTNGIIQPPSLVIPYVYKQHNRVTEGMPYIRSDPAQAGRP
eukprot:scaffold216499_cov39-Prasinocladus_malaysianus.AAC.2